ncbi:MAG: hypothetical protein OEY59_03215 [Deltaproteobacteria bacterium]|nr:hypothetical protein [Deltaproteobacteria bacterium]
MSQNTAKEKVLAKIRQANKAAAVGRLMLGELKSWQEFLQADSAIHENLSRRQWKSGAKDVKRRLSAEIKKFCSQNFEGMSIEHLSELFEEIKAKRRLELPVHEFESKYAKIKGRVISGNPAHSTIVFSLWGLQFKSPEDHLAKDVIQAISSLLEAEEFLGNFNKKQHAQIKNEKEKIADYISKSSFSARMAIIVCSSLVEAFLNGLSWEFCRTTENLAELSNNKKKLLKDGSFREKLQKYPEIFTGRPLSEKDSETVETFLAEVKPYRDSLMHPSPFIGDEKYGGQDKTMNFYAIDSKLAFSTVSKTILLIAMIYSHINMNHQKWFVELRGFTNKNGPCNQSS